MTYLMSHSPGVGGRAQIRTQASWLRNEVSSNVFLTWSSHFPGFLHFRTRSHPLLVSFLSPLLTSRCWSELPGYQSEQHQKHQEYILVGEPTAFMHPKPEGRVGPWDRFCVHLPLLALVRKGRQGILRRASLGWPSVSQVGADTSCHSQLWFLWTRGKLVPSVNPLSQPTGARIDMVPKTYQFRVVRVQCGQSGGTLWCHKYPFSRQIPKSGIWETRELR